EVRRRPGQVPPLEGGGDPGGGGYHADAPALLRLLRLRQRLQLLPPVLQQQHALEVRGQQAEQEQRRQQDADELAHQELPPRQRLAHQRDRRPPLDLLADRQAGGQGAEEHGG